MVNLMQDQNVNEDRDLDLLTGLKSKNEKAFSQLYVRYQLPVFLMINSIVKNRLDAEDLTIETFTKVFLKIDSYAPLFLFRTWLFKIARNTAFDYIGVLKNRLYGDRAISDFDNYIDSEYPNPEDIMISSEGILTIEKRMNMLTPGLKKVLFMRCFDQCSYEEISDTLGITNNEARVYLCRARKELKIAI
jgi:RNA polymerase sigma-70 factor (ECF subfamily)